MFAQNMNESKYEGTYAMYKHESKHIGIEHAGILNMNVRNVHTRIWICRQRTCTNLVKYVHNMHAFKNVCKVNPRTWTFTIDFKIK